MEKFYDETEYFKDIVEEIKNSQAKKNYGVERRILEEGKCEAFRSILVSLHPENADIWGKHVYSARELQDFVMLEIKNLTKKLKKARQIYIQNQRMISELTQLQVD